MQFHVDNIVGTLEEADNKMILPTDGLLLYSQTNQNV